MNKIRVWIRYIYLQSSRQASHWLEHLQTTEHLFMIAMAVIIGVVSGFGAVGIKYLVDLISGIAFGHGGNLIERISNTPWYMLLLIPTIGGLIVGPITHFVAPEARGHGVPEVMQAILTKGGVIRPVVALVKSFTAAVTIGTGGSVGKEGPIVQIGASIGSTIGQFFRVPSRRMKTLVGCGSAAGIAAVFNVPVAGALFAIEVILLDFSVKQFAPIVISSVIATTIAHAFVGNFAEFYIPPIIMHSNIEIVYYFVLGALCGLVSYLMIKVLYFSDDYFEEKVKIPPYLKPAIGGFMVGIIGIFFPQVMGVGDDMINISINNQAIWYIAFALVFLKIIATSITLGSGGSGGTLSPALFVGAVLGAFFGSVMNFIAPETTAQPGSYALVAMGGLIAGTVRAPLTAIILVFELTKESSSILPLMIVSTISLILSSKLSRESIYTLRLVMNKIQIRNYAETNVMKTILAKDVYSTTFISIPENYTFEQIVKIMMQDEVQSISVHDLSGNFMGMVSINNIKDALFDHESLNFVIIAGDIADKNVQRVALHESCMNIIDKMGKCNHDILPVMDNKNLDKQIGIIYRREINELYSREIEKIEMTSDLAQKITKMNVENDVQFIEGHVIAEIKVPNKFVGRTIGGLKIRNVYDVDIISIKTDTGTEQKIKAVPKADYILTSNDYLIVAGEIEKVNKLKNLI
ncbi:MAG: chloride channel protein [Ignavibacteriae bacterium HGW-Ignavibacteriae-1]|nr:MAG: chloride channel protein [Ignavibacteriae bacterium HGW-Ignavibacteriae-1]